MAWSCLVEYEYGVCYMFYFLSILVSFFFFACPISCWSVSREEFVRIYDE